MFTSCGWFFDEISGLEPVQILQYASRAIQLANEMTDRSLERDLLDALQMAASNLPEYKNGEKIYQLCVQPSLLDFPRIAAHIVTHFTMEQKSFDSWYIYKISSKSVLEKLMGKTVFRFGKITIKSTTTKSDYEFIFSLVHLGDHNLTIGIKKFVTDFEYESLEKQWIKFSSQGDALQLIRWIDVEFSTHQFSLTSLLRDTQSLVLNNALSDTFNQLDDTFERIYQENHTLLNILRKSSFRTPPSINATVDLIYNARIENSLHFLSFNSEALHKVIDEFSHWNPKLDVPQTQYLIRKILSELLIQWDLSPEQSSLLTQSLELLRAVDRLRLKIDFWETQKWAYDFRSKHISKIPINSQALFHQLLKQLKVAPITKG